MSEKLEISEKLQNALNEVYQEHAPKHVGELLSEYGDSLDLVELQVTCNKMLDIDIPDELFVDVKTVGDLQILINKIQDENGN